MGQQHLPLLSLRVLLLLADWLEGGIWGGFRPSISSWLDGEDVIYARQLVGREGIAPEFTPKVKHKHKHRLRKRGQPFAKLWTFLLKFSSV